MIIRSLLPFFPGRFNRQRGTCPDLPRGDEDSRQPMISPLFSKTCTHTVTLAQFSNLACPEIHNLYDIPNRHFRQGKVMTWGKADHTAGSTDAFDPEKRILGLIQKGCTRKKGAKIIVENEGVLVFRIVFPAGAFHSPDTGNIVDRMQAFPLPGVIQLCPARAASSGEAIPGPSRPSGH